MTGDVDKIMKIAINRKPKNRPWGGGNMFVRAFSEVMKSLGHQVVYDLCDGLDAIFMQDPRYDELGISANEIRAYKKRNPSVSVFHRVNECDARKATRGVDEMLLECSRFTDHTIFVSNWMKDYHLQRGWACGSYSVLYNGVNLQHFGPRQKIENGKTNIVTHHWSDNPMKGADVYEFLDEFVEKNPAFTFTYIGRTKQNFKNVTVLPPLSGKELGDCLGRYDVYVTGSRYDPGPNHVIESLACGIPTFAYSKGGGACEFVGRENVFETPEMLVDFLSNYRNVERNFVYKPTSWRNCIEKLNAILVGI